MWRALVRSGDCGRGRIYAYGGFRGGRFFFCFSFCFFCFILLLLLQLGQCQEKLRASEGAHATYARRERFRESKGRLVARPRARLEG